MAVNPIAGLISLVGRVLLSAIFLMSALGNKIPKFNGVVDYMKAEGVPAPQILLAGAIVFLIVGSFSLIVGYKARFGAFLLLVFLILATYWFHDFWTFEEAEAKQQQMIAFLKNLALMGAMLFVMANGAGDWSMDACYCDSKKSEAEGTQAND